MVDDDTHLAWAAGFLDGEGSFLLVRNGAAEDSPTRKVRISVSQERLAPLEVLRDLLGGGISTKAAGHGWQWDLCGAESVIDAINRLMPYLVLKDQEADLVLRFAKTVRRRGRTAMSQEEKNLRADLIQQYGLMRASRAVS